MVKNLPASAGNVRHAGSIPGLGRSPEEGNGNPLQYSCLENPMDRRAWWGIVHGVTQSRTQLKQLSMPRAHSNLMGMCARVCVCVCSHTSRAWTSSLVPATMLCLPRGQCACSHAMQLCEAGSGSKESEADLASAHRQSRDIILWGLTALSACGPLALFWIVHVDAHSRDFCGRLRNSHGCGREGKGHGPPRLTPRHVILA